MPLWLSVVLSVVAVVPGVGIVAYLIDRKKKRLCSRETRKSITWYIFLFWNLYRRGRRRERREYITMKRRVNLSLGAAAAVFLCTSISIVGAAAARSAARGSQQPPPPPRRVGTEFGFAIFQERCMICHGNPDASVKAPEPATLRQMTPEAILSALTTGVMKLQGQSLADEEKRQVAESLAGRPLGTATDGEAAKMPNRCATNPPLVNPASAPAWNGWGVDGGNTRFQPAGAAGLTADDVSRLTLRWAFAFPNGVSALSQPAVVSDACSSAPTVRNSLDAGGGCVWSFRTKAGTQRVERRPPGAVSRTGPPGR